MQFSPESATHETRGKGGRGRAASSSGRARRQSARKARNCWKREARRGGEWLCLYYIGTPPRGRGGVGAIGTPPARQSDSSLAPSPRLDIFIASSGAKLGTAHRSSAAQKLVAGGRHPPPPSPPPTHNRIVLYHGFLVMGAGTKVATRSRFASRRELGRKGRHYNAEGEKSFKKPIYR